MAKQTSSDVFRSDARSFEPYPETANSKARSAKNPYSKSNPEPASLVETLDQYLASDFRDYDMEALSRAFDLVSKHFYDSSAIADDHLGYWFQALSHTSFVNELKIKNVTSNERLEFLGDSVLGLSVSIFLFEEFSEANEGQLSKLRSALVNEVQLAKFCCFLGFDQYLLLGKGEMKNNGRSNPRNQARLFEALIGALYFCFGFDRTTLMLRDIILSYQDEIGEVLLNLERGKQFDPKTQLQEYSLKNFKAIPHYRSNRNQDSFDVELWIGNQFFGKTRNSSKKAAEKELAEKVLKNFEQKEL